MVLTRLEKEQLVLDLHNQGKGTREIAQEVKMSFSQIGTVLKRAIQQRELGQEQVERTSISTQAYRLFSEGKTSLQVAIELQLKADEAIEYQKEYWKLEQLDSLSQLYEEVKGNIWPFVNLHRLTTAVGMDTQQVINLLKIANNDIPRVESVIERLGFVLKSLETKKQTIEHQIFDSHHTLYQHRVSCQEEKAEIDRLRQKRHELEEFVKEFENDEGYLKIKKRVSQEVENTLANHRQLLDFALLSIIKSLRKDPKKLYILYYNLSAVKTAVPSTSTTTNYSIQNNVVPFMNEQCLSHDYNDEETCEKMLLDESKVIYDKMVEDLTNKTVDDLATDIQSPPSSSLSRTKESEIQKSSTQKLAAYKYRSEEHTFIQSEIDNENQDN
jgi:hypothetical protein